MAFPSLDFSASETHTEASTQSFGAGSSVGTINFAPLPQTPAQSAPTEPFTFMPTSLPPTETILIIAAIAIVFYKAVAK